MASIEVRRPRTVSEAVDALASGGIAYCGGTELVPVLRMGLVAPDVLVDLKRVEGLDRITETRDEVVIGARVTHDEASLSPIVRRHAGVLALATGQLGNARVRACGTVAGNICFAEPRSDVLTALLALGAQVQLRSTDGIRSVGLASFVEGALSTTRAEDELLESIRIPIRPARGRYVRLQIGEYPVVNVAVLDGPEGCRVVVGATGDRATVFDHAAPDDVDPDAIAARVDVIEDLSGREDYKRHLTAVFVRRAMARLIEKEVAWPTT